MSTVKMPSCTIREAESGIITGEVVYAMNFTETELRLDLGLQLAAVHLCRRCCASVLGVSRYAQAPPGARQYLAHSPLMLGSTRRAPPPWRALSL